jgi:hypothetical protein
LRILYLYSLKFAIICIKKAVSNSVSTEFVPL